MVPLAALAERGGLGDLAAAHVRPGSDRGANAGLKVACLSQLGKAHREFTANLARQAPLLPGAQALAFIDIDSTQGGSSATASRARDSATRRSRENRCWSRGMHTSGTPMAGNDDPLLRRSSSHLRCIPIPRSPVVSAGLGSLSDPVHCLSHPRGRCGLIAGEEAGPVSVKPI